MRPGWYGDHPEHSWAAKKGWMVRRAKQWAKRQLIKAGVRYISSQLMFPYIIRYLVSRGVPESKAKQLAKIGLDLI